MARTETVEFTNMCIEYDLVGYIPVDDLQGTFLGPAAGRNPFCGRPCPDPCLAGIR